MVEVKKLTCVVCPRGCSLEVTLEDGKITNVTGNTCKRGAAYAEAELLHPERMLTTTVKVSNRKYMLPVRTRTAIPKGKLFEAMDVIRKLQVEAPVQLGDVILSDLCGTGIDIVAAAGMN